MKHKNLTSPTNLNEKEIKLTGESELKTQINTGTYTGTGTKSDVFRNKSDLMSSPTKFKILHHHPQKAHNSPNLVKAKEIIEKKKLYKLKNYFVSTGAMKI